MQPNFTNTIEAELNEYRLPYHDKLIENYQNYILLLQEWGAKINLVGTLETNTLIRKHLVDCLLALPHIQALGFVRAIVDVGSGAGLPGLILAMADPNLYVHCVETNHKKVNFMLQVISQLRLTNVQIHKLPIQSFKQKADLITCRAYAQLNKFVAQSQHCLTSHGLWLAYKAKIELSELKSVEKLVKKVEIIDIPTSYADKRILVLLTPHSSSSNQRLLPKKPS